MQGEFKQCPNGHYYQGVSCPYCKTTKQTGSTTSMKTEAYVIAITQLEEFPYSDKVDMILRVGNDHHSLIGKFSITYIFEVLEALYHLKYGMKSNEKSNDY